MKSQSRFPKRTVRIGFLLFISTSFISTLYTNCSSGFNVPKPSSKNASSNGQLSYQPNHLPPSPTAIPATPTTPGATQLGSGGQSSSNLPVAGGGTVLSQPGVPLVGCSASEFEFPLPTHWSNNLNNFSEGALDAANVFEPNWTATRRVFLPQFTPDINKYIADRFERERFTDDEFRNWSLNSCAQTGVAVELRKPTSYSNWTIAKTKVKEERGSIQTLYGLIVDNNLVTVYLPPNWKKSDARGKYPILANGFYGMKMTVQSEGEYIARSMGLAYKISNAPFIGISWNGGGDIASRTVNPQARAWFNKIVQQVADTFGGDPQRVMIFGGSRGGMTSLAMASNPENYPYKVIAAYVAYPAVDFISTGQLTGATIPTLLIAGEADTGFVDSWKKSFRYPAIGSAMDGFTRSEAHAYILTGSRNHSELAERLNLSSPRMLSGLKAAGTQIFFEAGSHDIICPWVDQFRFIKKLEAYGIPFESRVNYLHGHSASGAVQTPENFARIMTKLSSRNYSNIFDIGKRSYYRNDQAAGQAVAVNGPQFTMEIPRYQSPSVEGTIIMTGIPGTLVEYGGKFNQAADYNTQMATLNSEGVSIASLSQISPGIYTITFVRIKKPGEANWKYIDLKYATTTWNPGILTVEVLAADPDSNSRAENITAAILKGYLGANLEHKLRYFESVSYGVVESDSTGTPPSTAAAPNPPVTPTSAVATCQIVNTSGTTSLKIGQRFSWSWTSTNAVDVGQTNTLAGSSVPLFWGQPSGSSSDVVLDGYIPAGQNSVQMSYSFWAKNAAGENVRCGQPVQLTLSR